jgi:hypothetical protein
MNLAPLAPLYESDAPCAAVCVDTSATDESVAGRRELQARQVVHDLAGQGADVPTREAVRAALRDFPHGPAGPAGRAVFARGGEVVLDVPLSVAPPAGAEAAWSRLPHVAPLVELAPDEPDCLVAYIDRAGADFELYTAEGSRAAGRTRGRTWPLHRTSSADWSERHFQLAVEDAWEQNARLVAQKAGEHVAETGAELLVLAGGARERRSVRENLPKGLAAAVAETSHGGRAAGGGTPLLSAEVEQARNEYLRRRTAEELDRFQAARNPADGRPAAAEGVAELAEAAREHRIDTLLLDPRAPDTGREVWVGADPDRLAARRDDARPPGGGDGGDPFPARADDALLRAAAVTGAEALCVPSGADGHPAGGLGALLRWSY